MIKDVNILLSVVNTYLRNGNGNLEDFAYENNLDLNDVINSLDKLGYYFDDNLNKFILK